MVCFRTTYVVQWCTLLCHFWTCGCSVVAGLVRSIDLSRPAMLDPVIHQLQHLLGWNTPVLSWSLLAKLSLNPSFHLIYGTDSRIWVYVNVFARGEAAIDLAIGLGILRLKPQASYHSILASLYLLLDRKLVNPSLFPGFWYVMLAHLLQRSTSFNVLLLITRWT